MADVVSPPLLCAKKPEGKTDGADSVIYRRLIIAGRLALVHQKYR